MSTWRWPASADICARPRGGRLRSERVDAVVAAPGGEAIGRLRRAGGSQQREGRAAERVAHGEAQRAGAARELIEAPDERIGLEVRAGRLGPALDVLAPQQLER